MTAINTAGSTTVGLKITVQEPALAAPSGLSYSLNPATYTRGTAITGNMATVGGGAVASYGVSPALPTGLLFSTVTGAITGTPTLTKAEATYTVVATNAGGSAFADLKITVKDPPAGPIAQLQIVSGDTQTGYAEEELPLAVVVKVLDAAGTPIPGQIINFRVTQGNGTVFAGAAQSDVTGTARERWTLGPLVGLAATPQKLEARAVDPQSGAGLVFGSFLATAIARPPTSLSYATNPAPYYVGYAIAQNAPSSLGGTVVSYTVTPTLPVGLLLNASTGILSGTPSAVTPSAIYTVTATNTGGNGTAKVTIAISEQAPKGLTYSSPTPTYTKGVAISPNTPSISGGAVTSFNVAPALPAGLSLNTTTGVISGTPTAGTPTTSYTVTAANSIGSTTATLAITVQELAPAGLTYGTTAAVYAKGLAITPNTPSSTGGAVASYSVSPALPTGLSINPVSYTHLTLPTKRIV